MIVPRFRTVLFVALAVSFLFWLRYGEEVLRSDRRDRSAEVIDGYRDEMSKAHPETANWIERQRESVGDRALAASIQTRPGSLASFESRQQSIRDRARLIALFERDPLRDDAILWSHGTSLATVSGDSEADRTMSDMWLTRLEKAKADPAIWAIVRDNPIALSSDMVLTDPKTRDFYAAHQAWIDDLVAALMQTIDDDTSAADTSSSETAQNAATPSPVRIDQVLEIAMAAHPHLKSAIPTPHASPVESAVVFLAFAEHGRLLAAVSGQNVPPGEAVEVLLLNADVIPADESIDTAETDVVAARLVRIYRDKKRVWDQARREPLVLRFDEMAPLLSQPLIERFPAHGVPSLVVTQYPDAAAAAAAAIDRYGELAIAVLVNYSPSDRFRALLGDSQIGYRSVMVAAMEGDEGIEKLARDPRYLDKLINEDGSPRQADWWQSVPVIGGIANVARNAATDRPSDWSELGWAAWDVVDAALIVGSLGASKLATEVGKQGLKVTARAAGREAATSAGTRVAARSTARTPALLEAITKGGGRLAPGAPRVGAVSGVLRIGGRGVALVARPMMAVSAKAVQASRLVATTIASAPPLVRLWVTRGLLGISLMARTPAMAQSIATGVSNFTAAVVDDLGKKVDAIKSSLGIPLDGDGWFGQGLQRIVYFAILGLFGGLAVWSLVRPSRGRRGWLGRLGY